MILFVVSQKKEKPNKTSTPFLEDAISRCKRLRVILCKDTWLASESEYAEVSAGGKLPIVWGRLKDSH